MVKTWRHIFIFESDLEDSLVFVGNAVSDEHNGLIAARPCLRLHSPAIGKQAYAITSNNRACLLFNRPITEQLTS